MPKVQHPKPQSARHLATAPARSSWKFAPALAVIAFALTAAAPAPTAAPVPAQGPTLVPVPVKAPTTTKPAPPVPGKAQVMAKAPTSPKAPAKVPAVTVARALSKPATAPILAEAVRRAAPIAGEIHVEVSKAYTLALPDPASTVFVANPDVADVQAKDPRRIIIFGRKAGATTVYVTTKGTQVAAYTVNVDRPSGQVQSALRDQVPGAAIQAKAAPAGLTVSGRVETPRQAQALRATAQQYLGQDDALNFNVGVTGDTQVNLQVRIVEVSRQVSRSFGFNWNALSNNGSVAFGWATGRQILSGGFGSFTRDNSLTAADSFGLGYHSPGGSADISTVIDALQSEGLISILAEPNLTAISGETASFLAGGEFPVPVSQQNNAITIEWKKFGVALDFTPTVLDPGRLSIKVRPEVSEITDKGSVTINNIKVPGIAVRRADTTVELASGQSFAIAGLFQNNNSSSVKDFPWLGELPVLGPLFRSSNFINDQSELVIIVTPYIVKPVSRRADLRTPADGLIFANDLEQILKGRVAAKVAGTSEKTPHLSGPAGFMLEEKH